MAELRVLRGRIAGGAARHLHPRGWGRGRGCPCALQAVGTNGLRGSFPPPTAVCSVGVGLRAYRMLGLLLFYRVSGKGSLPRGL